jgi:hypothetical protein
VNKFISIFIVFLFIGLIILALFKFTSTTILTPPEKAEASANWAGYSTATNMDDPEPGSVSRITGMWKLPDIYCRNPFQDYFSSFWIGIDGFSSSSVEQIGTEADCINGMEVYSAWYEMYPLPSQDTNLTLSPGDLIYAEINYLYNETFNLTLIDITTGESFSVLEKNSSPERVSAEWIVESPSVNNKIVPLTNFGPFTFINATVTINNHTGSINDSAWHYKAIVMEDASHRIRAIPSLLKNKGDSFQVVWEHY